MEWFRFYNDARSDNKLKLLTDSEFRVWINMLCLASDQEEDQRGTIPPMDSFVLAAEVAHADEALLDATVDKLRRLKMVECCEDGAIHFLKWDKRQFKSDSSTARVQKHREEKAKATTRNVPETLQQQPETPPDPYTEPEQKEREIGAREWGKTIPASTATLLSTLDARAHHAHILTAETDDLVRWHVQGMDWTVIDRGLQLVLERDKPMAYALKALKSWFQEGKRTLDDFVGQPGKHAPQARAAPTYRPFSPDMKV